MRHYCNKISKNCVTIMFLFLDLGCFCCFSWSNTPSYIGATKHFIPDFFWFGEIWSWSIFNFFLIQLLLDFKPFFLPQFHVLYYMNCGWIYKHWEIKLNGNNHALLIMMNWQILHILLLNKYELTCAVNMLTQT